MAPTAALVTVREPDGRTVYINQERMAELFIQALGDQYRHRVVPGDGITQRLTVIEAALRVQAAAAPADGLGIPPNQLSAVISALRTLNAVTNHAKHVFSADAAGSGCGPCEDAGEGGTHREVPPPHAGHPLENDSTGHFLEYENTAADGSTVDKLVGVTTADVAPMAAAPKGDMHCAGGTAGGGAARKWTCTACSTSHSVKKQACRRCGLGRPHLHPAATTDVAREPRAVQDNRSPLLGAAGVATTEGPQAAGVVSGPQRIEDVSSDKLQEGLAILTALGLHGTVTCNTFQEVLEKRHKV